MGEQVRRRPRQAVALVALAVVVLQLGLLGGAGAGFSATTARPGSNMVTDLLEPVTALTPSRVCTVAAPAFRAASTAVAQAGSVTITSPAGLQPGDALLALVSHHDLLATPDLPTGWTELERGAGLGGNWLLAGRVLPTGGAVPTSYSFTGLSMLSRTAGTLLAYSGVDPTNPWEADAKASGAWTTSVPAPSVTATTPGTRWVQGFVTFDYAGAVSVPLGTQWRSSVVSSAFLVPATAITTSDAERSTTGATGTVTATVSSLLQEVWGVSVLLRSATATATGAVTLSWQPTPDTYATGYEVTRTPGPVVRQVSGRTTTTLLDSTLAAATGGSYSVRAVYGSWRSSAVTVPTSAC